MTAQPHIMVVDDEPAIRRLLSMALKFEGYVVLEAEDGLDALRRLQASDSLPDVMLLDLRMPRMDGPTLLRSIQADARLRVLPVIALSATKSMSEGDLPGVAAFLDKPFNLDTLLDTIAAILNRGELQRAS